MGAMKAKDLLELLTVEDIKGLLEEMGSSYCKTTKGAIIFDCICHDSSSPKLYYYPSSQQFHCYVEGMSFSLWELVCIMHGWDIETDFFKAFSYVAKFKKVETHTKITRVNRRAEVNEDKKFLAIHKKQKESQDKFKLKFYDSSVLKLFEESYPLQWFNEGISELTAEKFDIRFDHASRSAIIPHRELDGGLVGVRCRNFDEDLVNAGLKYIPLNYNGEWYRYPTGATFYGLYENGQDIARAGKVFLFESEKSIMMMDTYYNGHGLSLALCGTNFTTTQRNILLSLGVKEITICLDKEYCQEWYSSEYKNTKAQKLMIAYFKKLQKMVRIMGNYFNISIIIDEDNLLEMKDSPIDKGREVFEQLLRIQLEVDDAEDLNYLISIE